MKKLDIDLEEEAPVPNIRVNKKPHVPASNDDGLPKFDDRHAKNSFLAQRLLDLRRERSSIFGSSLFSDPCSDILLTLFVVSGQNKGISKSKACSASDVPEATGLRYLRALMEKGYVDCESDIHDQRVVNVKLSQVGIELMNRWLSQCGDVLNDEHGCRR